MNKELYLKIKQNKAVIVIIPAYLAEKSIQKVISGIPDWVRAIIVVDDGSQDRTSEIVQSMNNPKISLIQHNQNMGVGGAMITGYKKSLELGADIIVKIDSDGQMDPIYMDKLIQPIVLGKADYTKGNRFFYWKGTERMPLYRKIGNLSLSFLSKLASGYWDIFDPTNGYTAISAEIIPLLDFNHISNRFFFETSMLIGLRIIRAVVVDVYIPAKYEGEKSHLSAWKSLFEFPPKIIKGFLRRIIYEYFIRDFTQTSLLLFTGVVFSGFGLIWSLYYWLRSIKTGVVTTTGTVMIGVLPVILGIQFLLQALVMDTQNIPDNPVSNEKFNSII